MKTYYTKEEVLQQVPHSSQTPFQVFGFNCIDYFCETSDGWVASFEDCCPFCVHVIIKKYGTKEDKERFNSVHNLGESYNIPLTRKDIALDNKHYRKNKQSPWWKDNGVSRKDLEKMLKIFRKNRINVQRVGKKNVYIHLDGFSLDSGCGESKFVYLPNLVLPNQLWYLCARDEDEVVSHIKGVVEEYNKMWGTEHKSPESYEDLIILEDK